MNRTLAALGAAGLVTAVLPAASARTLPEIQTTGTLRICVAGSSAPFYQANGEAFARFLGVRPDVKKLAEFDQQFHDASGKTVKEASYEARLLADGTCDLFPNDLHVLDWRESKMLMVPYYNVRKVVVARRDLRPTPAVLQDLAGRRAAIQKGTAYDAWLTHANQVQLASKPAEITYAPTLESVGFVAQGKADFTVVGTEGAVKWVREDPERLALLFPVDDPVQVGWGVSPRAKALAAQLKRFFAESRRVGSDLDQNWLKQYRVSLMEYQLFDASFDSQKFDWRSLLAWLVPAGIALLVVLAAMLLWNRRLKREVAERRTAEEALREASARLMARTEELAERDAFTQALYRSSPAGMTLTTPAGELRQVSPRWTQILGYTLEDLRGQRSGEVYADPAERISFLEALNRDGEVRNFRTRFRRKDGAIFWGLVNSTYVEVRGERLIASWTQDISELKEPQR